MIVGSENDDTNFIKMVELYSTMRADIQNMATKRDVIDHSENCEVKKNHRVLVLIGALLSGAGLVFGMVLKTIL